MSVPENVKSEIKDWLWSEADRLDWASLPSASKSRHYTIWTELENVGGRLAGYMDARQVRVYIKDTLLKPYMREASSNPSRALRVLKIPDDVLISERYIKPHGLLLMDGRQIAWSRASEWKATLMALHERAFHTGRPFAAVLSQAGGKFALPGSRAMITSAAEKLGVEQLIWLD